MSEEISMNGAESLVRSLVDSDVSVCFGNPGTSEMHFVAALDRVDGMRPVLGLFEGVVTGLADGYGRMADSPAATLLHLGPGFGNGLANLHNARRAGSPIVNIVGDHAASHAQYDAPLASDLAGIVRPVSGWVHTSTSARNVGADAARAVQAAMSVPRKVATLILPADVAWSAAERSAPKLPVAQPESPDSAAIASVAAALRSGRRTVILLGPSVLNESSLAAAGRIASATGAKVVCDTFTPRLARGAGRFGVARLPYFGEMIAELLADTEQLILVGAKPPVSFFAYPGKPSWCTPEGADILVLAHAHENCPEALSALADEVGAADADPQPSVYSVDGDLGGRYNHFSVGRLIAAHLPEGAIVSDEAGTSGLGPATALATAAPHEVLSLMGGSIGQSLPVAGGAAVACPDRKVVCLTGDGGAMYTLQSLWTFAREKLDVTTVVFANRSYGILNVELKRVGAEAGGEKAQSMFDLGNPELQWTQLAQGMGVEAVRVHTNAEFDTAFRSAMKQSGPRLIEVML